MVRCWPVEDQAGFRAEASGEDLEEVEALNAVLKAEKRLWRRRILQRQLLPASKLPQTPMVAG